MRKLISVAVLFFASLPVFAVPSITTVPEPEALALLAIGGVAMALGRRKK